MKRHGMCLWALTISFTACDSDSGTQPRVEGIASIEVQSSRTDLDLNQTIQLHAEATNEHGQPIVVESFTWRSSDTTLARVSAGGMVEGLSAGAVRITASAGGKSGEAMLTVRNARAAQVTIEGELSAPILQRVQKLYSVFDSAKFADGSEIRVAGESIGGLVVALGAEGDPLLASYAEADGLHIGVGSTALVLARFALNPLSVEGIPREQVTGALLQAPAFETLQAEVRQLLESGGYPTQSREVADLAAQVAQEARIGLGAPPPSMPGISRSVVKEAPYHFIESLWFGESLWIEDVTGPGVSVFNETRLDWAVSSRDMQGRPIAEETAEWLPYTFWSVIPWHSTPSITPLLGNSTRFEIRAEQTTSTRGKHAVHFFNSLTLAILEAIGVANNDAQLKCATAMARSIVNDKFPDLVTQATPEAAVAYLESVFPLVTEDPIYFYGLLETCALPLPSAEELVGLISKTVAAYWKQGQRLNSLAASVEFGYQMVKYWDASYAATVCKHQGQIGECVESVEITPDVAAVAPGETVQLTVSVIGVEGTDMSAMVPVDWTSSDPAVANVSQSGLVTAGDRGGVATITATSGGESGTSRVTVEVPAPSIVGTYALTSLWRGPACAERSVDCQGITASNGVQRFYWGEMSVLDGGAWALEVWFRIITSTTDFGWGILMSASGSQIISAGMVDEVTRIPDEPWCVEPGAIPPEGYCNLLPPGFHYSLLMAMEPQPPNPEIPTILTPDGRTLHTILLDQREWIWTKQEPLPIGP